MNARAKVAYVITSIICVTSASNPSQGFYSLFINSLLLIRSCLEQCPYWSTNHWKQSWNSIFGFAVWILRITILYWRCIRLRKQWINDDDIVFRSKCHFIWHCYSAYCVALAIMSPSTIPANSQTSPGNMYVAGYASVVCTAYSLAFKHTWREFNLLFKYSCDCAQSIRCWSTLRNSCIVGSPWIIYCTSGNAVIMSAFVARLWSTIMPMFPILV